MNYVSKKMRDKIPYEPVSGDYRIRLDANESPYNVDKSIIDEFCASLYSLNLNRYPDPSALLLRQSFAKRYGVSCDSVVAGNGSDELISVIMTSLLDKGDTLAVAYPDFSMYAFYAQLSENKVLIYEKTPQYSLSDLLEFVKRNNARAVVFSNPCNPTGSGFDRASVLEFVSECPALCIIDEAYMDFWDQSVIDEADRHENLVVLKTLSKAFGAAGLRLGFAVGHKTLINALNIARSPYNVNTLSQTLGKIILDKSPGNAGFLASQAKKLENKLKELLPDANVYPTCTNFVFLSHPDAEKIFRELLKKGIAIRYFSPDRLRITASYDSEIEELCAAISVIIH